MWLLAGDTYLVENDVGKTYTQFDAEHWTTQHYYILKTTHMCIRKFIISKKEKVGINAMLA
jgi:hypothetical protein